MKRRSFLLGGVSALVCLSEPALARSEPFNSRFTCLVVTDISHETSIPHLMSLFDVFHEVRMPFTCVVDPFKTSSDGIAAHEELSRLLIGYLLQGSLMEVAAYMPELPFQSEYFQGRGTHDASKALSHLFAVQRAIMGRRTKLTTLAHPQHLNVRPPTGVLTNGIRTVLEIPRKDGEFRSELWPNGLVRLTGGFKVNLAQYVRGEAAQILERRLSVVYCSARDFESVSPLELQKRARSLVDELVLAERVGSTSLQQAADVPFRDDYSFRRLIALHLIEPEGGDLEAKSALSEFERDLRSLNIEWSRGEPSEDKTNEILAEYWLPVEPPVTRRAEADTTAPARPRFLASRRDGSHNQDIDWSEEAPGHPVVLVHSTQNALGLDDSARILLPCLDISDLRSALALSDDLTETEDLVLTIRPNAIKLPVARNAIMAQLMRISRDGVSEFVTVLEWGKKIAPKGPEIKRQRRTVSLHSSTRSLGHKRTDAERQKLFEDARIAWQYFDRHTLSDTGLCPATVNFSPTDGRKHPTVTMWDVGSHINALIAARRLGLVESSGFSQRIAQLLFQIRGRETQGRLLPQGWLRVDRQKWGNRNFDGSDAGRLLSSLANLRRFESLDEQLVDLVGSWDLNQIIVDGEINSVTNGVLHSMFRSHSAHYAARAFRAWGIDVRSPYEVMEHKSSYDGQMALLEVVSWIGPMGAEPLLLEGLELGNSTESDYLSEVLFSAQFEEFQESGRLVAVSEGPIDVSPWFTYQGLQMDAMERTWALDTVGHDDRYMRPSFWQENLVISSKAAFLWAAHRPHHYSNKLVEMIRDQARTSHGFASSTFSRSGRVTKHYTDINTNAVILQAVAHMLTAS